MNKSSAAACAAWMLVCLCTNVNVAQAQALPSPWASRDIGGPALAGSAKFSSGAFWIEAAGEGIGGTRDQLHFVYQAISGDIDVRARIESVTAADAWSKAGVMIRSGLSADAAHAYALVSAGKGTAFQRRRVKGGTTTHTAGSLAEPPRWVRLVRAGTVLTALTSGDGVSWKEIGSDTIALGTTAYVGLAVTSHTAGMRTTSIASNVTLVSPGVPAGQASVDIGAPAISGSASFADGTYTISAAGTDIWGSADQFHYVYQPVTGNVDVIARVTWIGAADSWSKAGVMIRESLAAGSRHAMALTSAGKGYAFQRRVETDAWSDHTDGGSGAPPGWVRLVRSGTLFEAYRSADGSKWTKMGSATIAMADTTYVGIAVTSHKASVATTAIVDSLLIKATTTAENMPPAVVVSSPANGTTLVGPATLTVTAAASDLDGTIASVDFYANATLLGKDSSAPYSVTASSVPAGTYALKAVASDNVGASTVSDSVTVSVTGTGGVPSAVAFDASADHATLVTKYVLEVYASGATPGTSTPVATSDLGKPTPSSTGEIVVDRSAFFQALAPGSYGATVKAVGDGGSTRSEVVSFSR